MPRPTPLSLEVDDLRKRYGVVEALRGAGFTVAPGEIFGLLGPNGAGKTTCLECILGLRQPDSGRIRVGDVDAVRHPKLACRDLGAQLQSAALQDAITPREALRLFAAFYSSAAPAEELLERFGLAEKADARFASLSGGQKQRLFLALAFVNRPRLIVLDEPTVGLDPAGRRDLHALIRRVCADQGCTALLSTHYLDEAEALCDRVGILHQGRIVAVDTPVALTRRFSPRQQLRIRFSQPLPSTVLDGFAPADLQLNSDGQLTVRTDDPNRTVAELLDRVRGHHLALVEVQVDQATLEDVFFALTGAPYPETGDAPRAE